MPTVIAFRNEPHQRFFHVVLDGGEQVTLRLDADGLVIEQLGDARNAARTLFRGNADQASGIALGLIGARKAKPDAVLDVLQSPVFGKKGRIAAHIQVLAEPPALEAVAQLCFLETATIGLRHQIVQRETLPRDLKVVQVGNHAVRVKLAQRPQSTTAKAESDDTAQVTGFDTRLELRRTAEAQSLKDRD